jgi:hypothetical protein
LKLPDKSGDAFFDPPTVLVANANVYVFELVNSTSNSDVTGIDEYVSGDGGSSFTLHPVAVSYVPEGFGTTNPVIPLPGGDIGFGYVVTGANPAFQANSLASPTEDSQAKPGPYTTLNPSPNTYTVSDTGGQFASQLTGSLGVLGVFAATTGTTTSPCPSNAPGALVYAYAPLSPSTTIAQLNGGAGSPWQPLAQVDCTGSNPAVGSGPSGLGLLETVASTVRYRAFSPMSGFAAPVTVASGEEGPSPTLSQDGAGGIYATWVDGPTGVRLAFSSTGGSSWTGPGTLFSSHNGTINIGSLASGVNSSGQGWALYAANGTEYAQPFDAANAAP